MFSFNKIFVLVTLLISLGGCAAPPYPGIVNFNAPIFSSGFTASCDQQTQCRLGPLHILLMRGNGSVFSQTIDKPLPYIVGSYVTIYAGERLYLETALKDLRLKPLRVGTGFANPSHPVVLQLRQPAYVNTGLYRGAGGMVLDAYNPYSRPLVYQAAILPADKIRPETVSTCAVMPNSWSHEVWRVPVVLVWITDMHLSADAEPVPCH